MPHARAHRAITGHSFRWAVFLTNMPTCWSDTPVGPCLEQPAVHLIPFLEAYNWITLYPINPITLQRFREAFVTSRAKDDAKDAFYLAELLLTTATSSKSGLPTTPRPAHSSNWSSIAVASLTSAPQRLPQHQAPGAGPGPGPESRACRNPKPIVQMTRHDPSAFSNPSAFSTPQDDKIRDYGTATNAEPRGSSFRQFNPASFAT